MNRSSFITIDMTDSTRRTYANPDDGNTYNLAPIALGGQDVLWACPTNRDGTADCTSAIPETDFAERLSERKRARIIASLAAWTPPEGSMDESDSTRLDLWNAPSARNHSLGRLVPKPRPDSRPISGFVRR